MENNLCEQRNPYHETRFGTYERFYAGVSPQHTTHLPLKQRSPSIIAEPKFVNVWDVSYFRIKIDSKNVD